MLRSGNQLRLTRPERARLARITAIEPGSIRSVADLQAYVRRIGAELSKVTEGDNPTLPWVCSVMASGVSSASWPKVVAVDNASGVGSVGKLGNEAVSGVGMEISLSWDEMRLIDGTAGFIHRGRPGPMRCFMSSSNLLIFSRWARVLAWYSGVARSASSRRSSISRSRRCSAAF